MWIAIIVLVPVLVLGVITLISFGQGKLTAQQAFHEIGILNPIPKVSDLNPGLLILGAGGILAGIAALVAANKGQPYMPVAGPSFKVSNPTIGELSLNQPAPIVIDPNASRRR